MAAVDAVAGDDSSGCTRGCNDTGSCSVGNRRV
ncbi:Protein of unknown function [Pyronema omphalodes CBS 100304]|uniref:Uncharacterized protein n=1 Tax=Pyronema omphalodes (strain CBS 100304) TaxID=1076935 RepID=U4LWG1_PYROM|nr:Protein of unknown function [Pyronema omphalodes CBS 100304]